MIEVDQQMLDVLLWLPLIHKSWTRISFIVQTFTKVLFVFPFFFKMEDKEDKAKAFEEFKAELSKTSINKKNLQVYIDAYMNRVDITGKLASDLRCDALLVVGSKSSQCAAAEYMHSHMDKVCWIFLFYWR